MSPFDSSLQGFTAAFADNDHSFLARFVHNKPYDLDEFQLSGCASLEAGHNVVVSAPTGSGKTVIAEFAVSLALNAAERCFYTTPIKALSNQKFHDLQSEFGADNVGLMTGDQVINGDAPVLIMTTEVLRNMLYENSASLKMLGHVVMDEVHYLSDKFRGPVWEEVILNLDENVLLTCLSATIGNTDEFGNWLTTVRGQTDVVLATTRPVPLTANVLIDDTVVKLLGEHGGVSSSLKEAVKRLLSRANAERGDSSRQSQRHDSWEKPGRSGHYRNQRSGDFDSESIRLRSHRVAARPSRKQQPSRSDAVITLRNASMLPAIVFIFSRAGCEAAVAQCARTRIDLTDNAEQNKIASVLDQVGRELTSEDRKALDFHHWRSAAMRGFAAHHAGMLPIFRHAIEDLFTQGLIKVVFSTETLALGVNMPARSVLIERLVKFNGEARVELTPGEFTQLTGRAGRRGIDTHGNAIVLWQHDLDVDALAALATAPPPRLVSAFRPGYNMVVNLLSYHTPLEARRLLEQSFGQYQSDASVVDATRALHRVESELAQIDKKLPPGAATYLDLVSQLDALEKEWERSSQLKARDEVLRDLGNLRPGDVVNLNYRKKPELAVVTESANRPSDPRPRVVSKNGWWGRVKTEDFSHGVQTVGKISIPGSRRHGDTQYRRMVIRKLDESRLRIPKRHKRRGRSIPQDHRISQLRKQIRQHVIHSSEERSLLLQGSIRRRKLTSSALTYRRRIDQATSSLGIAFERIVRMLADAGYVEPSVNPDTGLVRSIMDSATLTSAGQQLRSIYSECDLVVSECLRENAWDGLDPAELAGVVSSIVFEARRDSGGDKAVPTEPMEDALRATHRIWEDLHLSELAHQVGLTRGLDDGLASSIHQWACGAPLSHCLLVAASSGQELTAGDFVRQTRMVIDLLRQISHVPHVDEDLRHATKRAVGALRRGVVAEVVT